MDEKKTSEVIEILSDLEVKVPVAVKKSLSYITGYVVSDHKLDATVISILNFITIILVPILMLSPETFCLYLKTQVASRCFSVILLSNL